MNSPDPSPDFRDALTATLGAGFQDGNEVTVLRNGCRIFPAMLEAIRRARREIDLLTYVYWQGDIAWRFAQTLAARAKDGVRVRIVLDAYGARPISSELLETLRTAGAEVRWFRPLSYTRIRRNNRRTHRKVLVCDGEIAFTGGVGIAGEWEGDARNPDEWRETHFRIRGPATWPLRASFLANWLEAGGQVEPSDFHCPGPSHDQGSAIQVNAKPSVWGWSNVMTAFLVLFKLARSRIRVTTPYFVPGDVMMREMLDACGRGVEVELLTAGRHTDQRVVQQAGEARYGKLMQAGVRIWRYQPTTLHAKCLTVDGAVACVGSINFNQRSMRLDEEVFLNIHDSRVVAELDAHFDEDVERAERYTVEKWKQRGRWQRLKEVCSHAFRSVF